MICGEGRAVVPQSPAVVLELVMDLHRYRLADHKIGRVYSVERDGDEALVRFRPRFRGLPAPVVRQRMRLTRWSQVDITGAGDWVDRLTRFDGVVSAVQTPEGTVLTHRECLTFRGPLRWVLEPLLRGWLARDTPAEVERLVALLAADR